jgi:hypothetical protein
MSTHRSNAYEKLSLLNEEISQGIKNLSSEPADSVEANIEELKTKSYRDVAPEAQLALLLFRKYADVANTIKDESVNNKNSTTQGISMLDSIPSFIYEGNRDELAGRESFRKNIFWYRVIVAVVSLIVFALFLSIHAVRGGRNLTPALMIDVSRSKYLTLFCDDQYTFCVLQNRDCPFFYGWNYGYFTMKPYLAAIVVCVLVHLYSIFSCLYYLLPVDNERHKYLPGLHILHLISEYVTMHRRTEPAMFAARS